VLGVVLAAPRALLHLGLALRDGLAHLERHQACVLDLLRTEHAGRLAQARRALREGAFAPAEEGLPGRASTRSSAAGVASSNDSSTSPLDGLIDESAMFSLYAHAVRMYSGRLHSP